MTDTNAVAEDFVPVTAEEAVNGRSSLGKTPDGNDPRKEFYFEESLDPMRRLPDNGYPYLDEVNRAAAEVARAKVEDREPDLENPPAYAGSPLRSAAAIDHPMNQTAANQLQHVEPAEVIEDLAIDEPSDSVSNPDPSGGDDINDQEVGKDAVDNLSGTADSGTGSGGSETSLEGSNVEDSATSKPAESEGVETEPDGNGQGVFNLSDGGK